MIWIVGILVSVLAGAIILRPILRGTTQNLDGATKDIALYKAQLSELDSDVERGVISAEDASGARVEISRRILAADKRDAQTAQNLSTKSSWAIASISMALIVAGSLATYATIGRHDLPDQPLAQRIAQEQERRASRTSQEQAEGMATSTPVQADPDYIALVERLRDATKTRPNDFEGLRLLALHEARLGNFIAARQAQQQVVDLLGAQATAQDYTDLSEYMIVATNGYVSPQAEESLARALRLDARDGRARYYSGLSMAQNGRPDVAFRLWQGLLQEGPEDAPWIALIRSDIGAVARAAGIEINDPSLPGPSADDVQAAQDMSNEDRQEMIRGMVEGLSNRLATEGGSPDEWARLIRALGVLGETQRADAIWQESKEVFKSDPNAIARLLEAAKSAEIAQ